MLVPLRFQPAIDGPRDAFHLLLDCHERIRTFTDLAVRLVRLKEIPPRELVEAVGRVERYFTVGLPLHVLDEDLSLAPRLREASPPPEVLSVLDELTRQHREIDAQIELLLPHWRLLRESPERHRELAPRLLPESERLAALMAQHLLLEEREVLPLARERLSSTHVEALAAEIRARRGQADGDRLPALTHHPEKRTT